MQYSVDVPNSGEFAAPEVFAEVARRAEEAGWDALLVWDHVVGEKGLRWEIADPWILLTAAALTISRIRLGTAITPVARRRPAKLAREVATLDRLTGGRMVLGAGLGEPVADEYASFGDTTDIRVLAERLDEGLHALDLLWSGEPVTYRGNQITIDDVVFLPTPVQRPRVPIWVGGFWPNKAPMRRAARWDGATPAMAGMEAALDHKILCAAFRADRRWDTDERSADRRLLRRREVHDRRRACPPGPGSPRCRRRPVARADG